MTRSALDPQALGLAIRLRREELVHSRPDLASVSGLSYPYVYEVERGKKLPSNEALEKLAGALDIARAELEDRAEELAAEHGPLDRAAATGREQSTGAPPMTAVSMLRNDAAEDQVDRLTAAVIARIEPIVREAIASAMGDTR